jgi:hypothetical protein
MLNWLLVGNSLIQVREAFEACVSAIECDLLGVEVEVMQSNADSVQGKRD